MEHILDLAHENLLNKKKLNFSISGEYQPTGFSDGKITNYSHNPYHNQLLIDMNEGRISPIFHILKPSEVNSSMPLNKGLLVIENSGYSNSLSLYSVTLSTFNNEGDPSFNFTIDNFIREVDGLHTVTRKGSTVRFQNLAVETPNSVRDLSHILETYFSGGDVTKGFNANVNNNALAFYPSPYSASAKIGVTQPKLPKKFTRTMSLSDSKIDEAISSTSFDYVNRQSKKFAKELLLKRNSDVFDSSNTLHEFIIDNFQKSVKKDFRAFLGSDFSKNIFSKRDFISQEDFFAKLDSHFSNRQDFFDVKNKIKGILANKKTITKNDFEKVVGIINSSLGFEIDSTMTSKSNSLEDEIMGKMTERFTSALSKRTSDIDFIMNNVNSSDFDEKLSRLMFDVFDELDSRKIMKDVIVNKNRVAELRHYIPKLSPNNENALELIKNLSATVTPTNLFYDNRDSNISNSIINTYKESVELKNGLNNDVDILNKIKKSKTGMLKELDNFFGADDRLKIVAYNHLYNSDAFIFSSDLSQDDLKLKDFFTKIADKRAYFKVIDLRKDEILPSVVVKNYSLIGNVKESELEKVESLMKLSADKHFNKIYFEKNTTNFVEIGSTSKGIKINIDSDIFTSIYKTKDHKEKVQMLKVGILNSFKDNEENLLYIREFLKGKAIRFSSGVNTEYYSFLMSEALNSLSESDFGSAYQKGINNILNENPSLYFKTRNVTVTPNKLDKRMAIINKAKNSRNNLIFFDVESTGSNFDKNMIDEITLRGPSGNVLDLKIKVGNDVSIDIGAAKVRGLTPEKLREMSQLSLGSSEAYDQFFEFIESEAKLLGVKSSEMVLAGHNIDTFDINFINAELKKLGRKTLDFDTLDTLELSRAMFDFKDNTLSSLYKVVTGLELDPEKLHEASYDTYINKVLFENMKERIVEINSAEELQSKLFDKSPDLKNTFFILNNEKVYSEYIEGVRKQNSIPDYFVKTVFDKLTVSDIEDTRKLLGLIEQASNPMEKIILENIHTLQVQNASKIVVENGEYFFQSSVPHGDGFQSVKIHLGGKTAFEDYSHVEKTVLRHKTNELIRTINEINNDIKINLHRIDDVNLDNPVFLYNTREIRSIKDIAGLNTDVYSENFKEWLQMAVKGSSEQNLVKVFDLAKEIPLYGVENVQNLIKGRVVASHSIANKESPTPRGIFHMKPFDFVNVGHDMQDESQRYFASMDVKPLNKNTIAGRVKPNSSSVVSKNATLHDSSMEKFFQFEDFSRNKRVSKILFTNDDVFSLESSITLTKKTAAPLQSFVHVNKNIDLNTISYSTFRKVFGNIEDVEDMLQGLSSENFNAHTYFKKVVDKIGIDEAVSYFFSNDVNKSILLDKEKNLFLNTLTPGMTNDELYHSVQSFELRTKALKDLMKTLTPKEALKIINGNTIIDNNLLKEYRSFVPVATNVGDVQLNSIIHKVESELFDGVFHNHSTPIFDVVNRTHYKVDNGLGYLGSHVDDVSGLINISFRNYEMLGSGSKGSVAGIKFAAINLRDYIQVATQNGIIDVDGVFNAEIDKRGLSHIKTYGFIQTALENIKDEKLGYDYLNRIKPITEALGLDISYQKGTWVLKDPLYHTLVTSGFDENMESLFDFLNSEQSIDLYRKNVDAYSSVKDNLAKLGGIDYVLSNLNKEYITGATSNVAKVNPILVEFDSINVGVNGYEQQRNKKNYGYMFNSSVQSMADQSSFEYGDAMKVSYFSESLLDVGGYSAFKSTFEGLRRTEAYRYLASIDQITSNKYLNLGSQTSFVAQSKQYFHHTIEALRNVERNHYSSTVESGDFNLKSTAFIDLDTIGRNVKDLDYSLDNIDKLIKHEVLGNEFGSKIITTSVQSNEYVVLKRVFDSDKPLKISDISSMVEFQAIENKHSFFNKLDIINKNKSEVKLLAFEQSFGEEFFINNLYNPKTKSLEGKVTLVSKKNMELYERMTGAMKTYLANSPIDVQDPNGFYSKTRMFFAELLGGEVHGEYDRELLGDVSRHLKEITKSFMYNSDVSSSTVSDFVLLRHMVNTLRADGGSATFSNLSSFFKNQGLVLKELNINSVVLENGDIISSPGLNEMKNFYRSYLALSDIGDSYSPVLQSLKEKKFSQAISDIKVLLGVDDTRLNPEANLKKMKNNLHLINTLTDDEANIKKLSSRIDSLLGSFNYIHSSNVSTEAIGEASINVSNEFDNIVDSYLKTVDKMDSDMLYKMTSDDVKKLMNNIVLRYENEIGGQSYFYNLLKTSDNFYALTDKQSPFFSLQREHISASSFTKPVDGGYLVDEFMDILFEVKEGNKTLSHTKIQEMKSIFGEDITNFIINNKATKEAVDTIKEISPGNVDGIADLDEYYKIKANMASMNNLAIKRSMNNKTYSEFGFITRHPSQTLAHVSAAKYLYVADEDSSNSFMRVLSSVSKELDTDGQSTIYFGNKTMKQLLGDYDSDKTVESFVDDIKTKNMLSVEFNIRNFSTLDNVDLYTSTGKKVSLKQLSNKTIAEATAMFGVQHDSVNIVKDSKEEFLEIITGVKKGLLGYKKNYFEMTNYLYTKNINSEIKGSPEDFMKYANIISSNKEISDEFDFNLKMIKDKFDLDSNTLKELFPEGGVDYSNELKVLEKTFTDEIIDSYAGIVNKIDDSLGVKRKSLSEIQKIFANSPDHLKTYEKAKNLINVGELYEYVSKLKLSHEFLATFDVQSFVSNNENLFTSAEINHLGSITDYASSRAVYSDLYYSAVIQANISAKKGRSLDINVVRNLVSGIQNNIEVDGDKLGDYFSDLSNKLNSYYFHKGDNEEEIMHLIKKINFEELYNQDTRVGFGGYTSDFGTILSDYFKSGIQTFMSQYKLGDYDNLVNDLENGNFSSKTLQYFLMNFTSFYASVSDTSKVAEMQLLNSTRMFISDMKGILSISRKNIQDISEKINDYLKSDEISDGSSFSKFKSNGYEFFEKLRGEIKSAIKVLGDELKTNPNDESLKNDLELLKTKLNELEDFSSFHKNLTSVSDEVRVARVINSDAEIFSNKDADQIEAGKTKLERLMSDVYGSKYYSPLNEKSSLYHGKHFNQVQHSIKSILIAEEFNKLDVGNSYVETFLKDYNLLKSLEGENYYNFVKDERFRGNPILSAIIEQYIPKDVDSEDPLFKNLREKPLSYYLSKSGFYDVEKYLLDNGGDVEKVLEEYKVNQKKTTEALQNIKNTLNKEFGISFEGDIIEKLSSNKELQTTNEMKAYLKRYNELIETIPKFSKKIEGIFDKDVLEAIKGSSKFREFKTYDEFINTLFENSVFTRGLKGADLNIHKSVLAHGFSTLGEIDEVKVNKALTLIYGLEDFSKIMATSEYDSEKQAYTVFDEMFDKAIKNVDEFFYGSNNKLRSKLVYGDMTLEGIRNNNIELFEKINKTVDEFFDEDFQNKLNKYADLNDYEISSEGHKVYREAFKRQIAQKLEESGKINSENFDELMETFLNHKKFSHIIGDDTIGFRTILNDVLSGSGFKGFSSAPGVEQIIKTSETFDGLRSKGKVLGLITMVGSLIYGVQKIRQHNLEDEIDEAYERKELLKQKLEDTLGGNSSY